MSTRSSDNAVKVIPVDSDDVGDGNDILESILIYADPEKEICAVCFEDESFEDNPIIFCDACETPVHQVCYGLESVPGIDDAWLCNSCNAIALAKEEHANYKEARLRAEKEDAKIALALQSRRVSSRLGSSGNSDTCSSLIAVPPPIPAPRCCVCPVSNWGALKPTTDGRWVHVTCGIWIPELTFLDPVKAEPVDGIKYIEKSRLNLKCCFCKRKGPCIQCHNVRCTTAYHPLCAFANGAIMETNSDKKLTSYCLRHSQLPGEMEWSDMDSVQTLFEEIQNAGADFDDLYRVLPNQKHVMDALYRSILFNERVNKKINHSVEGNVNSDDAKVSDVVAEDVVMEDIAPTVDTDVEGKIHDTDFIHNKDLVFNEKIQAHLDKNASIITFLHEASQLVRPGGYKPPLLPNVSAADRLPGQPSHVEQELASEVADRLVSILELSGSCPYRFVDVTSLKKMRVEFVGRPYHRNQIPAASHLPNFTSKDRNDRVRADKEKLFFDPWKDSREEATRKAAEKAKEERERRAALEMKRMEEISRREKDREREREETARVAAARAKLELDRRLISEASSAVEVAKREAKIEEIKRQIEREAHLRTVGRLAAERVRLSVPTSSAVVGNSEEQFLLKDFATSNEAVVRENSVKEKPSGTACIHPSVVCSEQSH